MAPRLCIRQALHVCAHGGRPHVCGRHWGIQGYGWRAFRFEAVLRGAGNLVRDRKGSSVGGSWEAVVTEQLLITGLLALLTAT